ncbi:hypothetical protein GCM10023196_053370 [Actinoallomurus vinaceus]|uniref:HTH lysR-type domain-containing protein n=1 Tax=Actinoallomurus vinaceus TaxID=1080074 RepID=A0ABP8UE48_9ACTN
MELRDIEIFLTLAEELHFGRTAERLHISQARVSQAIGQQERGVGGRLFDRPDITYLPIRDIDALPYAAVWHTESENNLIRALVQTIRDLGPRTLDTP